MLIDDLRQAWRRAMSQPATIVGAAAMLALGIGLTTAMFTLADALLLRPVPFSGADRLARLSMMGERGGSYAVATSVFRAWRASPGLESVEAANDSTVLIDADSGPLAKSSALVTTGLFRMLDVRPIRGRLFDATEGRAGTDDRVLISEDLWRSAFAADPAMIGRSIRIDGRPHSVIGIIPAEFRFPKWDTMIWRPIDFDAPPPSRATALPIPFVRFSAAMPETDALRLATEAAHGVDPTTAKLRAQPDPLAGLVLDKYYQRAVPLLFGGVGLVFLVLCANVSSLLLVRLTARRRELSVCSALGASRGRLIRQATIEHGLLGVAGTAAGVLLAWMLVNGARGFLPEAFLLRTLNPLNLDLRALAIASACGIAATLLAGLIPAWLGTRAQPAEALRVSDRGGTESRVARSMTRGMLVGEIALACTLLVGATLLVRSFVKLSAADRGLDSAGVLVARVNLPTQTFKDGPSRRAVTTAITDDLRRLPGVAQVAVSFGLPPRGGSITFGDDWRSDLPDAPKHDLIIESYYVAPDFFELYRIPILRGRTFQPGDTFSDVIIGERIAKLLWQDADPVGRSFTEGDTTMRVVGVAREINHPSLDPRLDRPEFYRPMFTAERGYLMMSIRCHGVCPEPAAIRQRVITLSAAVEVYNIGPIDNAYVEQLAGPRAAAALGSVFAGIAVVAAAGGLFGVLSYAVGRRRREIGIRTALGASRAQIRTLIMRDGLLIVLLGIPLGCGAGWLLGRALSSLQYGVTGADPVTWATVIVTLVVTTLIAAWGPTETAAKIDPLTLLREE
jgi:putative ABC transport system permease protein